MKYANFSNIGGAYIDDDRNSINIGDYMQIFAIDELYRSMGVDKDNIYYINIRDIPEYSGERLILPINFMLSDMTFCKDGRFIFPDDIIPVFVGVCIYRDGFTFSDYNIEYLKHHAPVGCRDYVSLNLLKSHGIDAYLAGCATFTIPIREKMESQKKVYLVDVPEFMREYIPDSIKKEDMEFRHHIIEMNRHEFNDEYYARDISLNLKREYEEKARLVVTSRLHCASPCIAMGIPTILVREYSGYTFEWIKQYIKIYGEADAKYIDWNESQVDERLFPIKNAMHNVACYYIDKAWKDNIYCSIEDHFFSYRGKKINYDNTQMLKREKLSRKLDLIIQNGIREYCIWGISEDAETIYDYMITKCPEAKLTRIIDTYRDVIFHGIKSEKPDIIGAHNDFFTIVTSVNAVNAAKDLFLRVKKPTSEYIFISDTFIDKM